MKLRTTHKKLFLLPTLLGCACVAPAGEESGGVTDPLGQSSDELYYKADGVWSSPSISVCWRSSAHSTERGWVKKAVETAFEPLTNIDFTGWSTCSGSGSQVAIEFDNDEWPRDVIGERSASVDPNMWLNPFKDYEDNNDNDKDWKLGIPEFQVCYADAANSGNPSTGPTGKSWSTFRRRCIETLAVHEFFHALAIHHEQDRDDTPDFCTDGIYPENDDQTKYGYWDLTSISNYCNPAWNNDGMLSPLDLAGMLTLYGEDDSTDYTWYSVGNVRDYSTYNVDQLMFDIRALDLVGNHVPLTGDFDGDGRDDVFYYGPAETDRIRWGKANRTFTVGSNVPQFDGTYVPVTGDFDGDGRDDIFLYNPGTGTDLLRWGRSDRTFDSGSTTVDGVSHVPLTGDFDGDGRDDIFLYTPGTRRDFLLWGRSDRTFDNGPNLNVNGSSFVPLSGDFDNDGRDDIYLYRAGTGSDLMRWGRSDRKFDSSPSLREHGTYAPTTGDFDGDGTTDILWSGDSDSVWLFNKIRGAFKSTNTSSVTGAKPYSGDFDGDGLSDVIWYEPG